jgi:hypothetical protein
MDKYSKLELKMKSVVTSGFLARDITNIIKEMIDGKYPATTQVSIVWTLHDVLQVQGFYLIEDIIREFMSAYLGRLFRIAAIEEGINIATPTSARRIGEMLRSTDKIEEAALPLIIEEAKRTIGVPLFVDYKKASMLVAQRDNYLKSLGML